MQKYAGVILVAKNGDLIFQQRDNKSGIANAGKITTFGGVVESDEEPAATVIRELKEELELETKRGDLELFGTYEKSKEIHGDDCFCYIFIAKNINPQNLKLHEGESIFYLKKEDNFNKYNFSVLAKQLIEDYNSKYK